MADEQKKKVGLQAVEVSFEKVKDKTLGEVFGTDAIAVTQISKKIWAMIKENNLRIPPKP